MRRMKCIGQHLPPLESTTANLLLFGVFILLLVENDSLRYLIILIPSLNGFLVFVNTERERLQQTSICFSLLLFVRCCFFCKGMQNDAQSPPPPCQRNRKNSLLTYRRWRCFCFFSYGTPTWMGKVFLHAHGVKSLYAFILTSSFLFFLATFGAQMLPLVCPLIQH